MIVVPCVAVVWSSTPIFSLNVLMLSVWQQLMSKNLAQGAPWKLDDDALQWFCVDAEVKSLRSIGLKASLAAGVYGIWRERNTRIFQGKDMDAAQLSLKIVNDIRGFLRTKGKLQPSKNNNAFCSNWGLPTRLLRRL